jgi:hypothetical protein
MLYIKANTNKEDNKMAGQIRDISDKGLKQGRKLRYEIGVFYAQNQEEPDIVAKFRHYGDALVFATAVQNAPVVYEEILIRS